MSLRGRVRLSKSRWLAVAALVLALAALVGVFFMRWYSPQNLLPLGSTPPDLSATDQHHAVHHLRDHRGKPLVVYFYPKDDTPGCTKQACTFRDTWTEFEIAGIDVLGVSGDSVASKEKFGKKYELPFPVLADPDNVWSRAFGVRSIFGITSRVTFLLDREGRVAKVYPNVDPALNVLEVLDDARSLP